jgi:hypothetical protein
MKYSEKERIDILEKKLEDILEVVTEYSQQWLKLLRLLQAICFGVLLFSLYSFLKDIM